MNKNDLIAAVVSGTGLSKAQTTKAVGGVFHAVADGLTAGDDVRLVGFGTFTVTHRAASQGRNPRTGEPIYIPAYNQPKFRAAKRLKDALN